MDFSIDNRGYRSITACISDGRLGRCRGIRCEIRIQILPGPAKLRYTPHDAYTQIGNDGVPYNLAHIRNDAYTDGHVEKVASY